jgi:hypothetical protein
MTEPRKRGRPPGSPKPPKEPKRMGRKTVWAEELGKSEARAVRAPKAFFEEWENHQFREPISNLILDIRNRKSYYKRVKQRPPMRQHRKPSIPS